MRAADGRRNGVARSLVLAPVRLRRYISTDFPDIGVMLVNCS
jgi:hypothetical protein